MSINLTFTPVTRWLGQHKFSLSGLLLILPIYFLYHSLNPVFPDVWEAKTIGDFQVSPMPFDLNPPYSHHGVYVKDFMVMFNQGDAKDLRQAYLNIGEKPLAITKFQQFHEGILHGSRHGQHVHALASPKISQQDKVWLTIENWQGEIWQTSWEIPTAFVSQ
ncbi:hypothetical protein [Colwellia sp. MEBiC06753]